MFKTTFFVYLDPDLKIPLVWPKGTYGLMMTIYGCPSHESFTWHQGYVIQDTEDMHNKNAWTTPSHVYGACVFVYDQSGPYNNCNNKNTRSRLLVSQISIVRYYM